MQGTFGAKEKVGDVYEYVKANLATPERDFYLFETPPKKILKDKSVALHKAHLIPSSIVYFAWTDLE